MLPPAMPQGPTRRPPWPGARVPGLRAVRRPSRADRGCPPRTRFSRAATTTFPCPKRKDSTLPIEALALRHRPGITAPDISRRSSSTAQTWAIERAVRRAVRAPRRRRARSRRWGAASDRPARMTGAKRGAHALRQHVQILDAQEIAQLADDDQVERLFGPLSARFQACRTCTFGNPARRARASATALADPSEPGGAPGNVRPAAPRVRRSHSRARRRSHSAAPAGRPGSAHACAPRTSAI